MTVYQEALDAYRDATPAPRTEEFPCSRCGAQAGEPCAFPRRKPDPYGRAMFHAPRLDRRNRAYRKWHLAGTRVADAAADAARSSAKRL